MMLRSSCLAGYVSAMLLVLTTFTFSTTTIHVPADQPTIQTAINAAANGDTVLVSSGTYSENINFMGKAIMVKSAMGAAVTIIMNNGGGATVTFNHNEFHSSVLQGFTIKGAMNTVGIVIGSSPTILNNVITGNHSCDGAGIFVSGGSPIIKGNRITANFHDLCSGGAGGGGIAVEGQGSAQIIGNVISGNDGGNGGAGGGISLFAAGSPFIYNNTIVNNSIQTDGGAIGIEGCCSDAIIVQNLIVGNSAPGAGGGIYSFLSMGAPTIVNNTIVNNQSGSGTGSNIYTNNSPNNPTRFYNNIIFSSGNGTDVYCDNFNTTTLPGLFFNDAYAPLGTKYGGICTDETGTNGNISADPLFVSNNNFRPKGGSLVIDAGDNAAPNLPIKDFAGNPRITNGTSRPTSIIDIGAYEFIPVTLSPKTLSFGAQAVGSTTSNVVKLANLQNTTLTITSYSVSAGYSVTGCGTSLPAFTACNLTVGFHPSTSGTFNGVLSVKDSAGNSPQMVTLFGTAQ